jgi:hypothetical protein
MQPGQAAGKLSGAATSRRGTPNGRGALSRRPSYEETGKRMETSILNDLQQ